jgi:hypothetical protein
VVGSAVGSVVGSFVASTSGKLAKSISMLTTTKSIHKAERDMRAFVPNLCIPCISDTLQASKERMMKSNKDRMITQPKSGRSRLKIFKMCVSTVLDWLN